jgi:hypothetical protein
MEGQESNESHPDTRIDFIVSTRIFLSFEDLLQCGEADAIERPKG